MSVHADSISISLVTSTNHADVRVPSNLLDNRWHTIEFIYKLGSLKFFVDRRETIIANSTYNTLFLTDAPNDDSAILIIGASYSGCMLQGPGINFSSVAAKDVDSVLFGPCPLIQGACKQNDIMIRAQIDQCLHDPCMSHGVCTSKADTYEVCLLPPLKKIVYIRHTKKKRLQSIIINIYCPTVPLYSSVYWKKLRNWSWATVP